MSDRHDPTWSSRPRLESDPELPDAPDPIGQLVRLAGARPPVPDERLQRVEGRVREAWLASVAVRRRNRWASWGLGMAAAAALAVTLGLAWRFVSRPPPLPMVVATVERVSGSFVAGAGAAAQPLLGGSRVLAGVALETAADGRAALRLPGSVAGKTGPSLRLDVDTRVRFRGPSTLRLERGAVYVDSGFAPGSAPGAASPGRPLLVETPFGEVAEHGTQFEVRVGTAGVRVRVREGSVELDGAGGGHPSWQAPAGEELTLASNGRLSRSRVPVHGEPWGWVQEIAPSYRLEGRTLAEFLAWVERETGWRVAWADPVRAASAATAVLHGSVDGLPPEQALAAVLPTCGLAARRDGESFVVFAGPR